MTMLERHLDVDQLSAAFDGEQDTTVSAHLLACRACRAQLTTWQDALGQLGALDQAGHVPADAVTAAMASAPREPARSRHRHVPYGPIAAAVAAVVLIAAGVYGIRQAGGGSSDATSSAAGRVSAALPAKAPANSGAVAAGPIVVRSEPALIADLRRAVPLATTRHSSVVTATPCYRAARARAAVSAVQAKPVAASAPVTPDYETAVDYQGVVSRIFVFTGRVGYVGFLLRSGSCDLIVAVRF